MVKFQEAHNRLYKNVFVCRVCKSKLRSPMMKVLAGKIVCKKCGAPSKSLRIARKKTAK
jgi:formylmethanofuran dehydrogenase subunit E